MVSCETEIPALAAHLVYLLCRTFILKFRETCLGRRGTHRWLVGLAHPPRWETGTVPTTKTWTSCLTSTRTTITTPHNRALSGRCSISWSRRTRLTPTWSLALKVQNTTLSALTSSRESGRRRVPSHPCSLKEALEVSKLRERRLFPGSIEMSFTRETWLTTLQWQSKTKLQECSPEIKR